MSELNNKNRQSWIIFIVLLFLVIAIFLGFSMDLLRLMLRFIRWFLQENILTISVGGKGASIGIKGDKISLDMTLLKWGNSGCGFTLSFDYRLLLVPVVIYNPQPVLQMIGR